MSEIKIVHCSDLHLDSSFSELTYEKASVRREEMKGTLSRIIDITIEKGADILLVAGDLFDTTSPSLQTVNFVCKQFSRIDIPIFISAGNHDFIQGNSYYNANIFPENVHIFGPQIESVFIQSLNTTVYGASFTSSTSPALLREFKADTDTTNVMCIHADIKSDSTYNAISTDDISSSNLDYLALGHVHTFSGIQKAARTTYAFSGTPEGHGFDECGEKGCVFVSINDSDTKAEFIRASLRTYSILEIDVSELSDIHAIKDAISSKLNKDDLYKIILVGSYKNAEDINLSFLMSELKDKAFFIKFLDNTSLSVDIDALLKEESIRANFLRALQAKDLDEKLFNEALKIGMSSLTLQRW